jgi:uncharacterized protein (DUF2267 family)
MTSVHVDAIDHSAEKAHVWLNELAAALGDDDRQAAYRILRAFLHALRDRLGVDEAAQLAAQLPLLVRGIYYEGWDPSSTARRYRDPTEFLDRVAAEALLHGDTEASFAVSAAAAVLRKHISAGEMDSVLQALPVPIGALLTEPPS